MVSKRLLVPLRTLLFRAPTPTPRVLVPRRLRLPTTVRPPLASRSFTTTCTRFDAPSSQRRDYAYIKSLASKPQPNTATLIDVREPSEFATGAIPGAINLPLASAPEALSLPAEEFEDRFGLEKPAKDREIVFYCKAGVRSRAAAELALREGYTAVGEYPGSWLDWVKNEETK